MTNKIVTLHGLRRAIELTFALSTMRASLSRVAVREPGDSRSSREPPLAAKAPAWQVALLCPRSDSVRWELENRGSLLEGEHFVGARARSVCNLDSADRNETSARGQPICEQFADQVLFMAPGRVSERRSRAAA